MRFSVPFPRSIPALFVVCASLLVAATTRSGAQNTVDPVFGGAGLGIAGNVTRLALQPDGKLLVGTKTGGLVRLNTDSSTDLNFHVDITNILLDYYALPIVGAVAVQPDGRIVVAGPFTMVNGVANGGFVRLNPDGTTDPSFAGPGDASIGARARTIVLQPDGKMLVGGFAMTYKGVTTGGLVRLNADGSVDGGFNAGVDPSVHGDSTVPTENDGYNLVPRVFVQADGKIVVGGIFTQANGVARKNFARFNADGTLDDSFNPVASADLTVMTVQADGKILVGGNFAQINGVARTYFARLNVDGSVDTSFNYNGNFVYGAIAQPDGRVLVQYFDEIHRVNANGSVDAAYAVPTGYYITEAVLALANGTVFVGGSFTDVGTFSVNSVVHINADGSVDMRYTPDVASGPNGPVSCLALQADGKMIIGGSFTQVGGLVHHRVARLKSDGTLDNTFNADLDDSSAFIFALAVQDDGKVLVGGSFYQVQGTSVFDLVRFNADGSLDTDFQPAYRGNVFSIIAQPDGKILISGDYSVSGTSAGPYGDGVVRLNADGSVDAQFDFGDGGGYGHGLTPLPDGKFLLTSSYLARLLPDLSVDPSFQLEPRLAHSLSGYSCAPQADGKIVLAGYFGYFGSEDNPETLVRINADGSLDKTFSANIKGTVTQVVAEADGTLVISGDFTAVDGVARQRLAHLAADGRLSPFVSVETGANGAIGSLTPQPDGKVLVVGSFTNVNGVLRNYVARLGKNGVPDFFYGQVPVGGGFFYQQFATGNPFGYYNMAGDGYTFPYVYHADLGMEYFFDAQDNRGGAYLYDFASNTFFYTSPSFPFPYLYDFKLNSTLYYYPDPANPGHYNTNGVRYFYNFATGQIFSK